MTGAPPSVAEVACYLGTLEPKDRRDAANCGIEWSRHLTTEPTWGATWGELWAACLAVRTVCDYDRSNDRYRSCYGRE